MNIMMPLKLLDWIDDNREHLKPPVCNKQIYENGDFIVQVVGGPNSRTDFHIDEGPELFYQVEGEMLLKTVQDGQFVDIPIKEGEIFLLPSRVPHSPQRFKSTVGIVVERKRTPEELDGFVWYCARCANKLHEEFLHVGDIVKDLPPVFERFYARHGRAHVQQVRRRRATQMRRGARAPGLEQARALDAADELGPFRRRFELPKDTGRTLTYLSGHSLGAMPHAARRAVATELDRWARLGVDGHLPDAGTRGTGHGGWIDYHERFAAPLAALVGASADEVVAMNTLTVNLHLMLVSFFRPTRERCKIVIERNAFPSDRYAVVSHLRLHGLDPRDALIELDPLPGTWWFDHEQFETLLAEQGERIALVLLPGVQYLSGEALDVAALTGAAARHGCKVGFDLAHAIGNVPLELSRDGVDFAVWCSYKYLNAGPGAVGGCFVHRRWAKDEALPRFAGWWGHDKTRRFLMEPDFEPLAGAQGWQLSNPPILSLAPLAASLELFAAAGLKRLRKKSLRLTAHLETLLRAELGPRVKVLTPAEPERRGCQLSVALDPPPHEPHQLTARLRAAGVVADWRRPNVLRLAPVPLYNRFRDVHFAVRALARVLDA